MNSYELDRCFPLQGTCFDCGRDMRHKIFDRINARFAAGESISRLAAVYRVPSRAIELVLRQNSVTPFGLSFKPSAPRAKSAAA